MKDTTELKTTISPFGALVLGFCLAVLCPQTACAVDALALDIAVQSAAASQAPQLVGDVILFAYKPDKPTHFVGARFGNENYAILHTFTLNENGVFILDYELPEGTRELRYRMVVDGLWMADPSNPDTTTDEIGNPISVFSVDQEPPRPILNPKQGPGGTFTFLYKGQAGLSVSLAGDFNGWDPFVQYFTEVSPGNYQASLRVLPGRHYYYIFTSGRRLLDPDNPNIGYDPSGNEVSSFVSAP